MAKSWVVLERLKNPQSHAIKQRGAVRPISGFNAYNDTGKTIRYNGVSQLLFSPSQYNITTSYLKAKYKLSGNGSHLFALINLRNFFDILDRLTRYNIAHNREFSQVKNDINMCCQPVIYYIYCNIYITAAPSWTDQIYSEIK